MDIRRIAITATLGLGMVVVTTGPALAAPPLGASCQGQFNGTINPAIHGTGQLNSENIHLLHELGLNPGQFAVEGAQIHDEDCTYVP